MCPNATWTADVGMFPELEVDGMAQQKSDDVAKSEESSHSDVVRALADLVADIAPGPKAQELSKQAKAVAARLQ